MMSQYNFCMHCNRAVQVLETEISGVYLDICVKCNNLIDDVSEEIKSKI